MVVLNIWLSSCYVAQRKESGKERALTFKTWPSDAHRFMGSNQLVQSSLLTSNKNAEEKKSKKSKESKEKLISYKRGRIYRLRTLTLEIVHEREGEGEGEGEGGREEGSLRWIGESMTSDLNSIAGQCIDSMVRLEEPDWIATLCYWMFGRQHRPR